MRIANANIAPFYYISLRVIKSVAKKETPINFEKSLAELEALVEKMEQGNLSLEESLKSFERGIVLTKACQQALSEAEQKIQILLEKDGKPALQDYITDDDNNSE